MWWIGYIHNVDKDIVIIKIDLLCPRDHHSHLNIHPNKIIIVVPYSDVLIKVNPRTVTGPTYTISKQESN